MVFDLQVSAEDIAEVDIVEGKYSLIILSTVLNFLKKSEAIELIEKAKSGLAEKGLLYLSVFSVETPGYLKTKEKYSMVEDNSFYIEDSDTYLSYFSLEEIKEILADLKIICYQETAELSETNGDYRKLIECVGVEDR